MDRAYTEAFQNMADSRAVYSTKYVRDSNAIYFMLGSVVTSLFFGIVIYTTRR